MVAMMKMMMMIVVVVAAVITAAMGGEVYEVGDDRGWTSIGHVDYKNWAATKLFRVGDTIVFTYNKIFHDVARVSYTDFLTCNGSKPYTTFNSGNDSFPIKFPGHYFFICTQPNHCKSGQKVDIRVPISGPHMAPQPVAAPRHPLPFPYPQPYTPSPSLVTPFPAPAQAPVVSKSPAPSVSRNSPAPSLSDKSPTPAPETRDAPAPEIAPTQQKNGARGLGIGFEILVTMVVSFYFVWFGF